MVIILKLTKYNKKRNFSKTKEPIGKISKPNKKLKFCVQHHLARKDHFDLRLEHNGTMPSWAVPKGPSYNPREIYENNNYIKRILNAVNSNMFCEKDYVLLFKPIFEELLNRDYYFVLADLEAFDKKMEIIEKDFLKKETWAHKAILNVARIGKFTSDRAVMEYADDIWNIKPC